MATLFLIGSPKTALTKHMISQSSSYVLNCSVTSRSDDPSMGCVLCTLPELEVVCCVPELGAVCCVPELGVVCCVPESGAVCLD